MIYVTYIHYYIECNSQGARLQERKRAEGRAKAEAKKIAAGVEEASVAMEVGGP